MRSQKHSDTVYSILFKTFNHAACASNITDTGGGGNIGMEIYAAKHMLHDRSVAKSSRHNPNADPNPFKCRNLA